MTSGVKYDHVLLLTGNPTLFVLLYVVSFIPTKEKEKWIQEKEVCSFFSVVEEDEQHDFLRELIQETSEDKVEEEKTFFKHKETARSKSLKINAFTSFFGVCFCGWMYFDALLWEQMTIPYIAVIIMWSCYSVRRKRKIQDWNTWHPIWLLSFCQNHHHALCLSFPEHFV